MPACSDDRRPAPHIDVEPAQFNFGKVKEGIKIRHVFKVCNKGNSPLEIDRVLTSCGCTVPTLAVKSLPPGASTELDVVMDTSLKQGPVNKAIEVFSNDPDMPHAIVRILADVEDLHKSLTPTERLKIFRGKCAFCHWKMGIGLEGEDLFKADCGMCHGDEAQGAIGPALVPRDYTNARVSEQVWKITAYGSKKHRSMPGFSTDVGGPLSKQEIDSLIKYLGEVSSKAKATIQP